MYKRFVVAATAAALPVLTQAAPVSIDGVIGAEWAGANVEQVLFNPLAPTSNFGTPTNQNHVTAYEIMLRSDANYLYTAVRTTGINGGDAAGLLFANLYFQLRGGTGPYGSTSSSIGFEITNDRAFYPATGAPAPDTAANLIQYVAVDNVGSADVLEAAIDLSVFTANALGVVGYGLAPGDTPVGIRMTLSQSFGYSVAGGQAFYGDERLGFVSLAANQVPEPGTLALVGAACLMGASARRRKQA